jgi:lysyl-tRNA synthetase class 2
MALLDDLRALATEAKAAFGAAPDAAALEAARVEYLGTRGRLKQLMGRMGEVPKEQKPAVGKRANETNAEIQAMFDAAKARVEAAGVAGGSSAGTVAGADVSSYEALKQERLDKLKAYQERGPKLGLGDGWGAKFPPAGSGATLTSIEEIRKKFEALDPKQHADPQGPAEEVHLAARVMLRRDQSKKLIFLTVQDRDASIQVGLWNSLLNEDALALLRDTLDLWDIVGIRGKLAFTQKGEPTVWATEARLLSKCILPPPDKHHGLHDKEIRYRQRYLDLITTPESRKTFILRAKAVAALRRFLDDQGFLEMETPVLQTIPGGAAARPFETKLNALDMKMYLRIATEIPLKKLLVGGLEKVYELGRLFRNEGIDARHNPEFTTVEAYQAYGDLRDMMALTENAVSHLAQTLTGSTTATWRGRPVNLKAPWPRLEYCELLKQHAGVSYDDIPGLDRKLREAKLNPEGMSHVDKIDGVFGEYAEPHLWDACFVINQPKEMAPLCRALPTNPDLSDRFEAFAAGMEICNAYSELNDAREQRKRLARQTKDRFADYSREMKALLDACSDEKERLVLSTLSNHLAFLIIRLQEEVVDSLTSFGESLTKQLSGAITPECLALVEVLRKSEGKSAKRVVTLADHVTDPSLLLDEDFLCALEHGMPPAGGLGLGIDRVVMLLANADSIRDVIPFPLMRPEEKK